MTDYYDLLAPDQEFAEKLGFSKIDVSKINYIEPRSGNDIKPQKNKINIIRGGDEKINQEAVRTRNVHVLLDPVNWEFGKFDTATANMAKKNNVAIGISHATFIEAKESQRVKLMLNLQRMVKVTNKIKNSIVIVSNSKGKYGMRAPLDLVGIGAFIGLTENQARWAISEVPKSIFEVKT